jgi:hypothetical protein
MQLWGSLMAQYRQVGNAVPFPMAYALGWCILFAACATAQPPVEIDIEPLYRERDFKPAPLRAEEAAALAAKYDEVLICKEGRVMTVPAPAAAQQAAGARAGGSASAPSAAAAAPAPPRAPAGAGAASDAGGAICHGSALEQQPAAMEADAAHSAADSGW